MHSRIKVDQVSAGYGRGDVLHELSFETSAAVVGLLGPNGAGKTTLLSVMTGARHPRHGDVALDGRPVDRGSLGYLPQGLRAPGGYTCTDFLRYVAWLREVPARDVDGHIRAALESVGLSDHSGVKVNTLSGGQQQRLCLAQAMVNEPSLLVLDEPTVGLDPEQRRQFLELVKALGRRHTVLMATHVTDDVASVCDEVVVIDDGRVRFCGSVIDLCARAGSNDVSSREVERGYLTVLGRVETDLLA